MSNVTLKGQMLPPEKADRWISELEAAPGSFVWVNEDGEPAAPGEEDRLLFSAPNGGGIGSCPIRSGGPKQRQVEWDWDGNREEPTLTPSVWFNQGQPGDWHGWLRQGRWEGC